MTNILNFIVLFLSLRVVNPVTLVRVNQMRRAAEDITGYYGRLSLLTRGQLTDPSLSTPATKTTTICEQWRPFANDNGANAHKSW